MPKVEMAELRHFMLQCGTNPPERVFDLCHCREGNTKKQRRGVCRGAASTML
ncbi:MAG: hypothetical protein PHE36_13205 [Novosphingobium sp.]|nr:hypothetical protein [Novosphingobium sp.]